MAARPGRRQARTVGYLAQEPQLDPDKTVGENVEEAFADLKAALNRFNEISMKFAEPMSDEEMNALLVEQGDLQEKIDARTAGNSTARWISRWMRCAARRRKPGHHAVRRRAAARRAVPAAAGKARPAAAGRTDQPPRCRKRRLAGAHAARLCRHRDGRHPRPLLPGQRHRLDPGARARPRLSVRGQLLVVAGAEAQAAAAGGEGGKRPPACPRGRIGVDRRLAACAADQEPRAYREV